MPTITERFTPTQCDFIRVCMIFASDGTLTESIADIDVYSATGEHLERVSVSVPWAAGEQTVIEDNIATKYAAFKTTNSFAEYEG